MERAQHDVLTFACFRSHGVECGNHQAFLLLSPCQEASRGTLSATADHQDKVWGRDEAKDEPKEANRVLLRGSIFVVFRGLRESYVTEIAELCR